ncbi:hypothetical protein EWM64_g9851 [Hericium alpestre]|uniref:DNA 3'-5' helicase n=1 Tax=Hericium alpestre TaxID=135208 RepID=A0A4Y9ZJY1_9AGAM|nr:hypothetical protein EWM64_g9851 [Hericium alpestre]
MVAVFPTNNLELEKEQEFEKFGLKALAINSLTLEKARKTGRNLWKDARLGISIIILSPEQLVSRAFEELIQDHAFTARIFFIGIDEIQLLDIWGAGFRKAFQQIGFIRARLPEHVVLIALTATLLTGKRHSNVCRFLGLKQGQYHMIHRSNTRYDIQLLVRVLTAGLGGWNFPDLDWVLGRGRKTIIFCKTILLGFQVMVYLWCRALPSPDRSTRIRSYNSLNSALYTARTQELMLTPASGLQIIITTDTLSQGVNVPDIYDVITMGEPTDPDEFFQRIGRAGRDPSLVPDARGIMYVPPSSYKTARTLLGSGASTPNRSQSQGLKKPQHEMHIGVARLLLAPCLRKEQDLLYDNPLSDPPCTCRSCTSRPPLLLPIPCNCSGCVIDSGDTTIPGPHCPPIQIFMEDPSKSRAKPRRLSPDEAKLAKCRLIEFRRDLWRAADEVSLVPPQLYLPDKTITALLNHLSAFRAPSDLDEYINANPYIHDKRDRLWAVICDIRQSLTPGVTSRGYTTGGDLPAPEACTSSTTWLRFIDLDLDLDQSGKQMQYQK